MILPLDRPSLIMRLLQTGVSRRDGSPWPAAQSLALSQPSSATMDTAAPISTEHDTTPTIVAAASTTEHPEEQSESPDASARRRKSISEAPMRRAALWEQIVEAQPVLDAANTGREKRSGSIPYAKGGDADASVLAELMPAPPVPCPPKAFEGLAPIPRYESLIGCTPTVDLSSLLPAAVAAKGVQLVGKCEFLNPGFSMKDRIVRQILDDAEERGLLQQGGTLVAASSGNTGASCAMVAAMRGFHAVIVTNSKCSAEKCASIQAYGAELIVVDAGVDYMAHANDLAKEHGWFDVNQYENHQNSKAHELTLGPQLWEQTSGQITHFVAGGSTGGTITGCGRALKARNPRIEVVLADPQGSIFAEYFRTGEVVEQEKFLVEGVGKGNIPGVIDFSVVDAAIEVTDEESFTTCHALASREGLLVGGSAGMNVCAALKLAATLDGPAVIATVRAHVPDCRSFCLPVPVRN
jgi:cystathionine beta-synthase